MKTLNHLRNEARQKLEYGITFFLKREHKFKLDGLNEVIAWLETLEQMIAQKAKPSEFLNSWSQAGMDKLERCVCDPICLDVPSLAWVHHNHSLLNQALWEIAEAYGIKRLRRVLKRDFDGPETFFNDIDGNPELDEPYGKILAKCFSKKLLDSFLLASGPSEDWVRNQAELACV